MTKRVVADTFINGQAYRSGMRPPEPPSNWFARGPRGGVYLATGARSRDASPNDPEGYIRDLVLVRDESAGARYVRPGTALHSEALAQLEAGQKKWRKWDVLPTVVDTP